MRSRTCLKLITAYQNKERIINGNFPVIDPRLEELENTKGVIRIRKSKDRQHNGQKKKDKRKKKRSTKHTHKTEDRVTRTPLKTGDEFRCYGIVSSSCATSGTRRVYMPELTAYHDIFIM